MGLRASQAERWCTGDLGGYIVDGARLILVVARLFLEFMSVDSVSDSLALV